MGNGSLASWKLAPPHDAAAQGLLVSAFSHQDATRALLLQLPPDAGGAWLADLTAQIPITDASKAPIDAEGPAPPSVALAFTWTGLATMGLDAEALSTFSTPFIEGMRQIDRQRRLGDAVGDGRVVDGGPFWSGNAPDTFAHPTDEDVVIPTPITVHAALLLYEADETALAMLTATAQQILQASGVTIVRDITLSLMRDSQGRSREHFGFVDGLSQPIPHGPTILVNGQAAPADPCHAVPAGDILIGHGDLNGAPTPGPVVREASYAAGLPPAAAQPGYRDLGRDGAYLVIRELRQNVAAFRASMAAIAATFDDPERDADWVAARVVGRTADGEPLDPGGRLHAGGSGNGFTFAARDPQGLGCPMGSHVRRANPRDGLAPTPAEAEAFLQVTNNHRILRRGRKFGPRFEDDPQAKRGMLFMALNTDLARQFEFIQQTWMLNRSFATLFDEIDPLLGGPGPFTLPAEPVRTRVDVQTFVRLVGGDYFFLPSLPAVTYLASLPVQTEGSWMPNFFTDPVY
jgi:Dyp-type peroxidase family